MGVRPSRGHGLGCCHWWSQLSGAVCPPPCSSTAGLSHIGGWGHRQVRAALASCPQPPPRTLPTVSVLTWLARSERSAQPLGDRCTRCHARCHSRSLPAERLVAVPCTGFALCHPLPGSQPLWGPGPSDPSLTSQVSTCLPLHCLVRHSRVPSWGSWPRLSPRSLMGPDWGGGSLGSGQSQPGPGPGCRGSRAPPPGSWAAGPPAPPRPGTELGPRTQGLPGSHRPGARLARARCSRVRARPCGDTCTLGTTLPALGPGSPSSVGAAGRQAPAHLLQGGPYFSPAWCLLLTMRRAPTFHLW